LFVVVSDASLNSSTSGIKVWFDLLEEGEWILVFGSNIGSGRLTLKDEIVELKYVSG